MAQAVEQYIPLDEDRWTLDQAFRYLTVNLGYPKERALDEMEQQRLAGHLVVQVHKVVDGKPQGDPEYLPPDKKHKLVLDRRWLRPLALKWGGDRCTVYKQRVLELWLLRPPAFQTAPAQQPEDKTGPNPLKTGDADRPSAGQSPQESLTSKKWLTGEVERRKRLGDIPETITEFSRQIHSQMEAAARAGVVKRVLAPRTIEQHLRAEGLFARKKRSQKS